MSEVDGTCQFTALQKALRLIHRDHSRQLLVHGRRSLQRTFDLRQYRFGARKLARDLQRSGIDQLKARVLASDRLGEPLDPLGVAPEVSARPERGLASGLTQQFCRELVIRCRQRVVDRTRNIIVVGVPSSSALVEPCLLGSTQLIPQ